MITNDQIQELSKKIGIDQETILREYLQILFLKNIYTEKESGKIFFKGGTAIHLLLGASRFSMDLDFTSLIFSSSLDGLMNRIIKRMNLEAGEIVLKSSKKKINHSYSKILSYYTEARKYPLNISIDFSLREKPVKKIKKTILKTDYPIGGLPIVTHLDWQEILAEKIRAILVREKGRDLYDLYYLILKNIQVDWEIVEEKLKIYPKLKKKFNIGALFSRIEKFENRELKKDLAQFLPESERGALLPILKDELIKELEKWKK
ncbi:MAG: nucleotidyl transferase AbiEii/AbiGii toxin family protein [Candidatus Cloacimonetes bacterium]|nr:nucleotidyl transferase AbiEii/AbiGii toxin family protein [Candidatus Cloacimonadota bacterium]